MVSLNLLCKMFSPFIVLCICFILKRHNKPFIYSNTFYIFHNKSQIFHQVYIMSSKINNLFLKIITDIPLVTYYLIYTNLTLGNLHLVHLVSAYTLHFKLVSQGIGNLYLLASIDIFMQRMVICAVKC